MRSTIQFGRGIRTDMSPRGLFFILFAILPVLVRGRGGGRGGGGGHSSHGGYSHGHSSHGSGSHTYPSAPNYSGNNRPSHSYPNSKTGLSGSGSSGSHHTTIHNHYHPPQQINYGSGHHPVYHGPPPVYVYTYHNSGSRYGDLLTGLALYNLGRMSAHSDSHYYSHAQSYISPAGEYCEFQIVRSNGEFEKTKMDCQLMSSFIVDADRNSDQERNRVVSTNTNSVTTTVAKGDNSSEVITTVQNTTTVVDSLQTKGPSIQVTPGMDCYMIRNYRGSTVKKKVDCGLLQQYARSSFSDSSRNVPILKVVILLCSVVYFVI